MKNLCCALFCGIIGLFFVNQLQGQIQIATDEFYEDLTACGDTNTINYCLMVQGEVEVPFDVQIALPEGIELITASLDYELSPMVSMILDDSDLSVFTITVEPAVPLLAGDTLSFSIQKRAVCDAIEFVQNSGVLQDEIILDLNNTSNVSFSPPYGLLFGVLNVSVNFVAGIPQASYLNTGLGDIDRLWGLYRLPSHWDLDSLTWNGVGNFTYSLSNDSILFNIIGAELGNGQTQTVQFYYTENNNSNCSNFEALRTTTRWGCLFESCDKINKTVGVANTNHPFGTNNGSFNINEIANGDSCKSFVYEFSFANNSATGDFYNLVQTIDIISDSSNLEFTPYLSNLTVNGQSIPFVASYDSTSFEYNIIADYEQDAFLEDLDQMGALNDLAIDSSFDFVAELVIPCPNDLIQEYANFTFSSRLSGFNGCGDSIFFQYSDDLFSLCVSDLSNTGQVDFWDNQQIDTVGFCFDFLLNAYECPTNIFTLKMEVPPGLSLSDIDPILAPYEEAYQIGDSIFIVGIDKISNCFEVLFDFECMENIEPAFINWEVLYACDEACDCNWLIGQDTLEIFTHQGDLSMCVADGIAGIDWCQNASLMTLSMGASRLTAGYENWDLSTKVNLQKSTHNTMLAIPCDTILVAAKGMVLGTETVLQPHIRIIHDQIDNTHLLDWIGGTVHFYDQETATHISCELPDSLATIGFFDTLYTYTDLDLSDLVNDCYSFGTLTEGDSINLEAFFQVVSTDKIPSNNILDISNFRTIHYSMSDAGDMCTRGHVGQRFYLTDINPTALLDVFFENDFCDGVLVKNKLDFKVATTKNQFSTQELAALFYNEVRPTTQMDSMVVILPPEMNYQVGSSVYSYFVDSNYLDEYTIDDPIISSSGENTKLLFINNNSWPILNDTGSITQLSYRINSGYCEVIPHYETILYYRNNAYSDESCQILKQDYLSVVNDSVTLNKSMLASLDVSLSNTSYSNIASNSIVFEYCNNGEEEFSKVFAMVYADGIAVDSVSSGTLNYIDPLTNLVQFSSLAPGDCIEGEIFYRTIGCDSDRQINLDVGQTCGNYPTAWKAYECANFVKSWIRTWNINDSELQMDISSPTTSVALCDTIFYEILLNSAGEANVMNPSVLIDLPEAGGFYLAGDSYMEYPLETSLRPFTSSVNNNQIEIDLAVANEENPANNFIDMEYDGLRGLNQGTLFTRQARLFVAFVTDCNYVAGSQFMVTAFGEQTCGDPCTGSGSRQLVEPISIEGVEATHTVDLSVSSDLLSGCSASHQITVVLNNLGPDDVVSGTSITAFLPQNIHYESIVNSSLPLSFIEELSLPSSNQVLFEVNETIGLNESLEFTIDLLIAEAFCLLSNDFSITVQSLQQTNANCLATGQDCTLEIQTNINSIFDIAVERPIPNVVPNVLSINCGTSAGSELSVFVENNGNIPFANPITVQLFYDENDDGVLAETEMLEEFLYENELNAGANDFLIIPLNNIDPSIQDHYFVSVGGADFCWNCTESIIPITEVQFNNPVGFEPTPICNADGIDYTVYLFQATGMPPFTISGVIDTVVMTNDFNLSSQPIPIVESYNLTITDANDCTTNIETNFSCAALNSSSVLFAGVANEQGNVLSWELGENEERISLVLERYYEEEKEVLLLDKTTKEYLDEITWSGEYVYQLKEQLVTGEIRLLSTVLLSRKGSTLMLAQIMPNPTYGHTVVHFLNPKKQIIEIEILSVEGSVVYSEKAIRREGSQKQYIDFSNLASGIYFIKITDIETTLVKRMVKL